MANREEHFADVDNVLDEVREMRGLTHEASDLHELNTLELLLKITKELHNLHSLRDVITAVLDSAIAFVEGERAFMMLVDASEDPHFKMGRDNHMQYLSREDFSPSQTVIDKVIETHKTLVVPDAQADVDLSKRASIQGMALRSITCTPLIVKKQLIGLLYVDSNRSPLPNNSKAYVKVLASLAEQSAVAIRNAQKFETHT